MIEISESQKKIYNLYLKAYRKSKNSPFREKKNFDDVAKDEKKIHHLKKLESLFKKYPALLNQNYFDAPYKIYHCDKDTFYPLSFYSSQKGISTCLSYIEHIRDSDPESQFEYFKESYKFIANFCVEKRIPLEQYTKYCSVSQNDCLIHLKQHKISWYIVFSVPHFYELLYSLPPDEFQLYFGTKVDLNTLYNRYSCSRNTVDFLNKLRGKIAEYVRKQLQSSQSSVK